MARFTGYGHEVTLRTGKNGTMAHTTTPVRDGFLRVLGAVTTPLVPSDYLDVIDPLRSGAALRGRIQAITPETADAVTVLIRPGRGWQGHLPGQYVRIGIDVDGVRLWRAYSLTSGPRRDGLIAITVKAIPDGKVSNHIVRRARPGTVIQLDQATGDFHLPATAPQQVLFLTAGSGITPVMGMLRHRLPELADVVVLHSAPTPADVIFGAELRDMAAPAGSGSSSGTRTPTACSTPPSSTGSCPTGPTGRPGPVGPTGLLDALEARWAGAGVPDRLHTERFRPHIVVTGEGGAVTFARSGTVVEADGATPLLDAGEAAGVLMPSGCRMGICLGCVVPLSPAPCATCAPAP